MLPDRFFTVSMSYDAESADLTAVVTDQRSGVPTYKQWTTTAVPRHTDNEWHNVRDLLIDWIGDQF